MSNTQNYISWGETIGQQYDDVQKIDAFPFTNQWRGRPLSQHAYIRNNVAGFYPYEKMQRVVQYKPEPQWVSMWYFPCSTMFPPNPQFAVNQEIFLER